MIKRADEWGDDEPQEGRMAPLCDESCTENSSNLIRLPAPHLSAVISPRVVRDARLQVTFLDRSPASESVLLVPSEPVLFSPLDDNGQPVAHYRLLTDRLKPNQLGVVQQILADSLNYTDRVPPLEALRRISRACLKTAADCWHIQSMTEGNDAAATHPRMALHIPSLDDFLRNPEQIGRRYRSQGGTGSAAYDVRIVLSPERSSLLFTITSAQGEAEERSPMGERFTLYCPAAISMHGEQSLKRLREEAWHALEKLWDSREAFRRHVMKLRTNYSSTYKKNLLSGASFTTRTNPNHTVITASSCTTTSRSQNHQPGTKFQWLFKGNMEHPLHPLHPLLAEMKRAIKRPEADGQLAHAVDQLVQAALTYPDSKMTSKGAQLSSLVDNSTLRFMQKLPGVLLHSLRPRIPDGPKTPRNTLRPNGSIDAIVQVLQGVSSVRLQLTNSEFLSRNPQAFQRLTLGFNADRSVLIQADSPLGISTVSYLSETSRFVRFLSVDSMQLVCAAFARQQIKADPTDARIGFLQILQQLVQFDAERSYLTHRGDCRPPPPNDEVANKLFDAFAIPLVIQLRDMCGDDESLFRVESRVRGGLRVMMAHKHAPIGLKFVFTDGHFEYVSVFERAELPRAREGGSGTRGSRLGQSKSLEQSYSLPPSLGSNLPVDHITKLMSEAVSVYGQLVNVHSRSSSQSRQQPPSRFDFQRLLRDYFTIELPLIARNSRE
jgi:hypothetical protein